jgi:glycosyltransferase involved in cell wall biosynthesis
VRRINTDEGDRVTRVAYVCADPGVPIFGHKGPSVHARAICGAFLEAGYDLTLFASRRGGETPPVFRDVPVFDLPAPTVNDPLQRECEAIAANDHISETLAAAGPFDVVYERAALWTVAPMMHATRTEAVGIVELNAPIVDEQARYRTLVQAATARRLLTSTLNAAHLVVAVSDGVARWARQLAPAANVHIVPNGVDVRRFTPAGRKHTHDGYVVGFVGTLKPWHGLPALIDAFATIAPDITQAHLKVVGDGPERARIIAQVRRRGLLEQTTLTGSVPHEDVPALLRTMDVTVAPYPALDDFYFSPLKLTEYMAAGLPVVASRIGQVRSLVRHEETGLLFPPGDARELAGALRRLYDDPPLRRRLGAAAREFVAERCTWTGVLDRIVSLAGLQP